MRTAAVTRLIGAAAVAAAACAPPRPVAPPAAGAPAIPAALRVRHNGRVDSVAIDPYAAAVALTEIAPGAESPATAGALYEAQIIVARTYAASRRGRHGAEGFDLCDATHCQRYEAARLQTARWAQLARTIAARTTGQVLVHQGRLIEAVFHADCGGHTADARDVWGTARAYLVAQRDLIPEPQRGDGGNAPRRGDGGNPPHRAWTTRLERDPLTAALAGDRRTRIEPPLRDLRIARRDGSGRAARIRLVGRATIEVNGDVFRSAVSSALGIHALPSTRFTLRRDGDGWQVSGTGFGHGVGLCQAGALSRARAGAGAAGILGFYYPGAIIRRAGAG